MPRIHEVCHHVINNFKILTGTKQNSAGHFWNLHWSQSDFL